MGNQREKWRLTIVLTMLLLGMALGGCADREILVYGQSAADSQERFLCAERPLPEEEADQPRLYESNGKILQNGYFKKGQNSDGNYFLLLEPVGITGIPTAVTESIKSRELSGCLSDRCNGDRGPPASIISKEKL